MEGIYEQEVKIFELLSRNAELLEELIKSKQETMDALKESRELSDKALDINKRCLFFLDQSLIMSTALQSIIAYPENEKISYLDIYNLKHIAIQAMWEIAKNIKGNE